MMNMGDLGNVGDIGGIVGSVVIIGIAAIVLLTFAPTISGDIDGMALNALDACKLPSGERFLWIIPKGSNNTADEAWARVTGSTRVRVDGSTLCVAAKPATKTNSADVAPTFADYYTPKGTVVQYAATAPTGTGYTAGAKGFGDGPSWDKAGRSLTALGSGSGGGLVGLIFGAMALGIPAGAIGFLAYFGAKVVRQNIGGSPMAVAIGATVAVVIIGAILPEVFQPLDNLYIALDGIRYYVFSQGIGKLGGVLGNFLGISLVGGLVSLGVMLWRGRHGSEQGMGSAI